MASRGAIDGAPRRRRNTQTSMVVKGKIRREVHIGLGVNENQLLTGVRG